MKLIIVDVEKTIEHDVSWVELNTPVGNMVIQEGHVPIIIELQPEEELLFETLEGKKDSLIITQAVAHVTRSEVKILLPLAV